MAITGFYEGSITASEPMLEAYVELPRMGVWGKVKFLVDTGADRTTLYPGQDNSVHINYSTLRPETLRTSAGIGGSDRYYGESARLVFPEGEERALSCFLNIDIWQPDPSRFDQILPSLLGRDFLNLCDVRLNHAANIVALDPLSVDNGFILPP